MKRNENKEDDYFDKMLGFFAGSTNDPLTSKLRFEINQICVYDFYESCYNPCYHPSLAFFHHRLRSLSHTHTHTHTHQSTRGYVAIPSLHPTQHPSPRTRLLSNHFHQQRSSQTPPLSLLNPIIHPNALVAPFLIVVDSQKDFCGACRQAPSN